MWANFIAVEFSRTVSKFKKKKKESCYLVFSTSTRRKIRHFHVVAMQRSARKCTKVHDVRAKVLNCQAKPIAFLPFPVAVAVVVA